MAAFLSLGSDHKPFIYDSGTDTKHWLDDEDWKYLSGQNLRDIPVDQSVNHLPFAYADMSDLKQNPPPPRSWALEEWLPLGFLVVLFSLGGLGKSLLAQILATHFAAGIPLFGKAIMQGAAIGFFCEDDNDELRRRQVKINAALNLDSSPDGLYLEGRAGKENTLFTFDSMGRLSATAFLKEVDAECAAKRPVLLIIDNIAQVFAGLENDRHQVTVFCNALTGIAQKHQCCILLLGHTAKAEGSEWSGTTAWEAAVRARLWLRRCENGLLELHRKKANYAGLDQVTLQWQDGYLHVVGYGTEGAQMVNEAAKAAVVQALSDFTRARISTSNSPQARNYLPKLMQDNGKLDGLNRQSLNVALSALVNDGTIIPNAELGWKTPSRHLATGLLLAQTKKKAG